jgi:ubiquinone/menaquinone biosynthesis C-methylase UbiE
MFNVDKQLNYGRSIIEMYAKQKIYKSVLDLGAGQGIDLDIFKKAQPSIKTFAVENWTSNQDILKSKGHSLCGHDIEKDVLPFDDCSIDCIIMNQILEHTKDIFWILHECTRVLNNKGSLIIGVPNLAALHNRLILLCGLQPYCIKTNSAHVRGYTKNGIVDFLKIFPNYSLDNFNGSNFYPFSPFIATPLSKIFPSLSVCIFLRFSKHADYKNEFIRYPLEKKLATNFFIG